MSHPLVIANWKMNLPLEGISGWIQSEMVSNNDKGDFDNKSSYFEFMGIAPPISHLAELKNLFRFGFVYLLIVSFLILKKTFLKFN